MPFCSRCGSQVPEDAQFCPNCGAPMGKAEEAAAAPEVKAPRATRGFVDRMIGSAMLDASVYEEVEADRNATTQALLVVALGSVSHGIGNALAQALRRPDALGIGAGFLGGLGVALIGWIVWSFITYYVGTRLFGGKATYEELLRTIGFSNSPSLLGILTFIPFLGGLVAFLVPLWGLVAMIVAVRQGLDFTTGRALMTCVVGLIAYLVIIAIVSLFITLPFALLGR